MATVKQEGVLGDINQVERARLFRIDPKLSKCLANLGELTVHGRELFSSRRRTETGAGFDIDFNGSECKISLLGVGGCQLLPVFEALTENVKVEVMPVETEGVEETTLVFLLKNSRTILRLSKDSISLRSPGTTDVVYLLK